MADRIVAFRMTINLVGSHESKRNDSSEANPRLVFSEGIVFRKLLAAHDSQIHPDLHRHGSAAHVNGCLSIEIPAQRSGGKLLHHCLHRHIVDRYGYRSSEMAGESGNFLFEGLHTLADRR